MNTLTILSLFILLPICASISCYVCTSGSSGCDPIDTAALAATVSSGNNVCVKYWSGAQIGTYRRGDSSCPGTNVAGIGVFCCYTDLCNGAITKYQTPFLLGAIFAALFAKYQFL
ncbi:hypothetical protein I4U23_022164 [Adineta vaga]|nr:hypothetical protein I4U23_022164 [Adineta vaga]